MIGQKEMSKYACDAQAVTFWANLHVGVQEDTHLKPLKITILSKYDSTSGSCKS